MTGWRVGQRLEDGAASNGPEDDEDRVRIERAVRVQFSARLRVLGRGADERGVLQYSAPAGLLQFRAIS